MIYIIVMIQHTKQLDNAVILPKQEYLRLKQEAEAYRNLAAKVFELPLRDPVSEILADFRSTDLYNEDFLIDLEDGLRKSSYTKKYAHQASQIRH